jgi:short-subunit dehydrogenase involved in D-alanine esterification of teichoic acids
LCTDRTTLEFNETGDYQQFIAVVDAFQPTMLINTIGVLEEDFEAFENNFWANGFPAWCLYEMSKNYAQTERKLKIILISSTAAGQPRIKYPLYAATKSFELALFKTASEIFSETSVSWCMVTLPALNGGLRHRIEGNSKMNSKISDDPIDKMLLYMKNFDHGQRIEVK